MLVHEETRAIYRARTVELPELAQCRRLAGRMILQRLRVRARGASLRVEDAHGVGNNVEDRFELRDASAEGFTQLFALADVVAREKDSAAAGFLSELNERGLDEAPAATMLKRH